MNGRGLPEALRSAVPGGRMITLDMHPAEGQPLVLSEFGGIACRPSGDGEATWGYSVTRSSEELRTAYERLLSAVHGIDAFAGFCYTQLTDTFQEANGLFTDDRRPKFEIDAMRRATEGPPLPEVEVHLDRKGEGPATH